jgi:hypothetical protein
MKLDRYKHTILRLWLIEWLLPTADNENAWAESINTAMHHGENV